MKKIAFKSGAIFGILLAVAMIAVNSVIAGQITIKIVVSGIIGAVVGGIVYGVIILYFLKRGDKIMFSKKETEQIKKYADKIIKKPENLMKNLYGLCVLFRKSKVICDLHRNQDKNISKNCDVCFKR